MAAKSSAVTDVAKSPDVTHNAMLHLVGTAQDLRHLHWEPLGTACLVAIFSFWSTNLDWSYFRNRGRRRLSQRYYPG